MVDVGKEYKRHFLFADLVVSVLISLIFIFSINFTWSSETIAAWISANKKEIYSLIATIGGTLLGFVITGVSIIIAFSESEKLRLLKQSKQYKTIYDVYFSTIRFLAITTVVPIIGIIINDGEAVLILYFLIWSVLISSFRIWRCIWVLESIVEILHKPNE